ncbi:MAG TPA: flagellar filament capping protein FliD [Variovorax sp.]|nr:flagellar filament capping protein FliD [Variovorax sp.]
MAISSIGVGSNLDLGTLLTNLETAESQPLKLIQSKATSYTTRLSAFSQVQSALNGLKTASDKLNSPTFFQTVKAAVGDSKVLSAAASESSIAGSYTIDVTQLARSQSLVSAGQAGSTTAIGTGKITLQFGTIDGGTLDDATGQYTGAGFEADVSRPASEITIDASNNTLEGIRNAINKANAGVTASIVNDGSGTPFRLVLASTRSGEASSMRISVAGDAALQGLVGYDPAGVQSMRQTAAAQDAKLNVNGIDITSSGNTVSEAIQGTTLTLSATGKTDLRMTADTATVSTAITAFVSAYNSLQATSTKLTAYDADTKTAAALTGDQTLRTLLSRVRQALATPQSGGTNDMKVLSEIGITLQKDGTLAIDNAKLDKAMSENLPGVAALFTSDTAATSGYAKQMSALVTDLTSTGGALTAATDGINSTLDDLSDQYDAMQKRVDATVARYRAQFTQLDVLVASMNNTMSYLTQQFEAMSNSTK